MEKGDHFFTFYIFSENVVAPCWLLPFSSPHANFSTWTILTEMFKIAGNNLHKGPFHNQQLKCLPQVYFSLSNPPKNQKNFKKLVMDMQNIRHIVQNAGHTMQNDGCTMQNVGRNTHDVSCNTLNVCLGPKGGLEVSRNDFQDIRNQKIKK